MGDRIWGSPAAGVTIRIAKGHRNIQLFTIGIALVPLLVWGWTIATRPLRGHDPASDALRAHIEAGLRKDCAAVYASLTAETKRVASEAPYGERIDPARALCDYSPATADLSEFETDRIRHVSGSATHARSSATFTYDRFFGFFGRGRGRYTYELRLEDGHWKIDLTESLDRDSRTNRNQRAMQLIQDAYMVISDFKRETGILSAQDWQLRAHYPHRRFVPIGSGIATSSAPTETVYAASGPGVVCITIKSSSGTLVMIKYAGVLYPTWQSGEIPSTCDARPLARKYYGASMRIR